MPLSWEDYFAREEAAAEGYCNTVRAEYGLDMVTGDEHCEKEPCSQGCKWVNKEAK